jgi:hypothetical protein
MSSSGARQIYAILKHPRTKPEKEKLLSISPGPQLRYLFRRLSLWIEIPTRPEMKFISIVYVINATLLILHEIESAYEKEWELLKLPVQITGFLLVHIPIILLLFWGLIEIEKLTKTGLILGMILGVGGVIPAVVHKIAFKKADQFNLPISNGIIVLNIISGISLLILSISMMG